MADILKIRSTKEILGILNIPDVLMFTPCWNAV